MSNKTHQLAPFFYAYAWNRTSFVHHLMPSDAVKMPTHEVLYILSKKLGDKFHGAMNPYHTIESPLKVKNTEGGAWIKKVNMVGINVRTIQSFWNVVKYNLTLSDDQNAIHLLPIWEPGVVSSLYGMSSWRINHEFFSEELYHAIPQLDNVEKQLKVVINVLHALGKVVGMDVIPHTDRFSEQALANPQCFEWLQRIDFKIVRHDNNLHEVVQDLIADCINQRDTPSVLWTAKTLFSLPENDRIRIMLGNPDDYWGRLHKREEIMNFLYKNHFETVPATMGPPYRGLEVDKNTITVDEKGRKWADYKITKPEKFSRVFGPLTRYKLFENKNNNDNWEIDFKKPIIANWEYVARQYAIVQSIYNIDFMRGDMAHVQMRPQGVPKKIDTYYDILGFIKKYIQKDVPYFANFAETFLAPAGEMAYGDEVDHLEASDADSTLGDLQSMIVGSKRFLTEFERYLQILHTRQVAPNFTLMTGDKDDPRFDEFYLKGNEIRQFIALFLTEMPSYMGLGFEQRDPHFTPAPNEHYTKLYVFHLDKGEKATKGNYVWGENKPLFERLNALKIYAESIKYDIQNGDCQWLIKPSNKNKVVVWKCNEFLFVANLDIDNSFESLSLPPQYLEGFSWLKCDFSTVGLVEDVEKAKGKFSIKNLAEGEGRVFKMMI
jgi:small nuclear ribonucleoprotein (snRNP)-like protein